MRRKAKAFTLVELLIVMMIVALLILIFIPQIAAITNWYKVHLSTMIMQQLQYGVEEYKRVYGEYPHDTIWWNAKTGRLEGHGENSYSAEGYESLYLALQGPDGAGWGPTADEPGIKEFGPVPESPGFVAKELAYRQLPRFQDPFRNPILYYSARLDSQYPHVTESYGVWKIRYIWYTNDRAWEGQRGADEKAYGYGGNIMYKWGRKHWAARLTKSRVGDVRYPYNEKSYVLWLAGGDRRFGYWVWSDEHRGFVADTDPENAADGRVGQCDDVTNF